MAVWSVTCRYSPTFRPHKQWCAHRLPQHQSCNDQLVQSRPTLEKVVLASGTMATRPLHPNAFGKLNKDAMKAELCEYSINQQNVTLLTSGSFAQTQGRRQ
jgi:hypothetical protein